MPNIEPKIAIQNALLDFVRKPLAQAALTLLKTLGYRSDKRLMLAPNSAAQFKAEFDPQGRLNTQNARLKESETC